MKQKKRKRRREPKTTTRRDEPDWSGITFESSDDIKGNGRFMHDGYRYCNRAEMLTAAMLDRMGIRFTPDVDIVWPRSEPKKDNYVYKYRPDILFDGDELLWASSDGTLTPIHGLENKRQLPNHLPGTYGLPLDHRMERKQGLLYESRGILIVVVSDAEVAEWAARFGRLPLWPMGTKPWYEA